VKEEKDPTMHAEMVAIRKAAKAKGIKYLKGCTIYCTCYPCPMCLGAIKWANISRVFYGCRPTDASEMCIDDLDDVPHYALILSEVERFGITADKTISIDFQEMDRDDCLELFSKWPDRERQ
jgi:guanine deaminase